MTEEKLAEEYLQEIEGDDCVIITDREERKQAFIDGYNKANEWHKVTNWEDNDQFPDNNLKTYLVRLYQDHYVICELEITEGYRQFYLLDNLEDIDPQDVIAWKEIVLPKE